jgi:hypothetical protein
MSSASTTAYLASDVATSGTFTAAYPAGTSQAVFGQAVSHKMYALGAEYSAPKDFTVAFTSVITVTWLGATTMPAGTTVRLGLDILGADVDDDVQLNKQIVRAPFVGFYFGAPITAAANSYALSQSVGAGAAFALNGARGGTPDVPRNVVAAWTGTAVVTVRGTDVDGALLTEASPSGATFTGKKAFASITSVTSSAAITAATVGCGLQLGFPARISATTQVVYEVKNGVVAAPTGTSTVGITIASTATTGDVRGTYAPLTPTDGLTSYTLIIISAAPDDRGVPQYVA